MPEPQPTLQEHDGVALSVARLSAAFRQKGLETPEIDARALVCGIMGIGKVQLLSTPDLPLGCTAAPIEDAMRRRLAHEPVSRILGRREFYGRSFAINPDVLDPRPETETVVELALEIFRRAGGDNRPWSIADIGTGSGCILLTLLAELPKATGLGTDISAAAINQAQSNAAELGLRDRASFLHTRGLAGGIGNYDLVVSNPPYIAGSEIPGLAPEVRDFDPILALDGGPDGLTTYREIANDIMCLKKYFWLILELGQGQLHYVREIIKAVIGADRIGEIVIRQDLAGHNRVVAFEIHP